MLIQFLRRLSSLLSILLDMSHRTTKFINQSLTSLQKVLISITTDDSVPSFRSSTLTQILRRYFSIDCKICLLATVSATALSIRGNLNALKSVSMFTGLKRSRKSHNSAHKKN